MSVFVFCFFLQASGEGNGQDSQLLIPCLDMVDISFEMGRIDEYCVNWAKHVGRETLDFALVLMFLLCHISFAI